MNLKSGLAVAVAFILAMQVASFPAFLLPINAAAAQGVILGITPIAVNYDLNSFGRTVILAVQYQTGITTLETCSSVNPENVLLTLTLPEHTSFVSETNGAGIFDPATRTVTWSLGTLDAATNCFGTQISITINVDNAVLDGTILGPATAAISTTTLGDDPIDNTRSVTFQGGMLPLEVFYTEIELRCTASGASDRETADGTAVDCSANAPGFLQSRVSSHADASPSITPQKLGELRVGGSPITTPKVGVSAHAEGDFNCDFTVLPPDPLPCLGISQSAEADVVNMLFEVKNPNPFAVPLHVHSDRFGYAACSDNNSGFPGSAFIEDSIQSAECSSSTGTVSPGNGETSSSTLHADLDSATGVCDIDRIDVINGERTETHSPTTCNPIAANTQGLVKGLNIIFDSGDANGDSNVIFSGSGLTIIKSGYGTYNAMAQSTIGLGGQQFSFPALMKITANSPVQLLLTDQEGRSVGVEPVVDPDLGSQGDAQVAQRIVANIPGSQYTGPVSEPQEISIGLPNPGTYNLDVRGTGSGQFTITVETFDENGNIISHNTITGQASPGSLTREELTVQTGGTPPVSYTQSITTQNNNAKPITVISSDEDNDTLQFSIVSAPTHGTLSALSNTQSTFVANLNGTQQVPPTGSTATGTGIFSVNNSTNQFSWSINYTGFNTTETASHIHNGSAGTNGPVIIILSPGTTKIGSAVLTAAQKPLLFASHLYTNIHSTLHPSGEIRGQIIPGRAATVLYTPNTGFTGSDSFTFKSNDGTFDSSISTVTINVIATPPQPGLTSVTISNGASSGQSCVTANNCFNPQNSQIQTGDTVTWTNTDATFHTVTSGTPSGTTAPGTIFNSGAIAPGQTFSHLFSTAGTFDYFCQIHPWMTGVVTVTNLVPHTTLTKIANVTSGLAPLPVLFTYTENNTGTAPLKNLHLSDDTCSPILPSPNVASLGQSATTAFTCTHVYTTAGKFTNNATLTATACNDPNCITTGDNVTEKANATVTVTVASTTLTKSANVTSGLAPLPVKYSYVEKNDGTAPINNISVSDNKCSPVTGGATSLLPGQSATFTCVTILNENTTNIATATGTTLNGAKAPNETAQAKVSIITVTPVNHPPSAVADKVTTSQGKQIIINVLANDTDIDGDVLTVQSVKQPTSGVVTINTNQTLTYKPNTGFSGVETFTYTISDGHGGTSTADVTVTVTPISKPPTGTPGKVTGGGAQLNKDTNFGFNVQSSDGITFKGELEYQDRATNINLHSVDIKFLSVNPSGTNTTFSGTATVNGKEGFTFKVYVEDNGEPGSNDKFSITIKEVPGGYTKSVTLAKGNVQIHK